MSQVHGTLEPYHVMRVINLTQQHFSFLIRGSVHTLLCLLFLDKFFFLLHDKCNCSHQISVINLYYGACIMVKRSHYQSNNMKPCGDGALNHPRSLRAHITPPSREIFHQPILSFFQFLSGSRTSNDYGFDDNIHISEILAGNNCRKA